RRPRLEGKGSGPSPPHRGAARQKRLPGLRQPAAFVPGRLGRAAPPGRAGFDRFCRAQPFGPEHPFLWPAPRALSLPQGFELRPRQRLKRLAPSKIPLSMLSPALLRKGAPDYQAGRPLAIACHKAPPCCLTVTFAG